MFYTLFSGDIFIAPVENNLFYLARNALCPFSPNPFNPPNPLIPCSRGRRPSYLNVPTALVFVVGSTTQTATELATFVLVTDETDFGFTKPKPWVSIRTRKLL